MVVVMGVCFTLHIFDQTQCPGCGDQRPGQCQQIHHGLCLLPMFKQLLKAEFDRWATGKFIKYISRLYSIKSHKALESIYLYAFSICKLRCVVHRDLQWYQNMYFILAAGLVYWCDPRWPFCFSPPINIGGCPRVTPVCGLRLYTPPPHNTLPTPD